MGASSDPTLQSEIGALFSSEVLSGAAGARRPDRLVNASADPPRGPNLVLSNANDRWDADSTV
jgi:hypothetical protein